MDATNKIDQIVREALTVKGEDRQKLVEANCGNDFKLQAAVFDLLKNLETHGPREVSSLAAARLVDEILTEDDQQMEIREGAVIGDYRLLKALGEGGFGVVFLAEQKFPVRRRVALKVIKPGMDSQEVIARFEAERQALALMDHPNIARMFEAGQTKAGRPYFVMEVIDGMPITEWCNSKKWAIRDRIVLFLQVCEAVQHAHQKGIIHRDLKPSNIFVVSDGESGVVKVIDFGVAKALSQSLTDKTMFTMKGQVMGTISYMSPEQAEPGGPDVDTRGDIYSLGVVLYELITGRTPLDETRLKGAGFSTVLKIIREEEPTRPSLQLGALEEVSASEVAAQQQTSLVKLCQNVRGDLDWIVLKALAKEPERRYQSIPQLAADLRSYLADGVVSATPPSAAYRLKKLIRRHRPVFVTGAVVTLVLVGSTLFSLQQAIKAEEAATKAQSEAESKARALSRAESITNFMINTLRSPDPARDGPNVTVLSTIDRAVERLDSEVDDPLARARILDAVGHTYLALAQSKKAISVLEHARQLKLDYVPDDVEELCYTLNNLSAAYRMNGEMERAVELYTSTRDRLRQSVGNGHEGMPRLLTNLARAYFTLGKFEQAAATAEEALDLQRERTGDDHHGTVAAVSAVGDCYRAMGRTAESIELLSQAWEQVHGNPDISMGLRMEVANNLAMAQIDSGDPAKAVPLFEEAHGLSRQIFEELMHPHVLQTAFHLGVAHCAAGNRRNAMPHFSLILKVPSESWGKIQQDTLRELMSAVSTAALERSDVEAGVEFVEAAVMLLQSVIPSHWLVYHFTSILGEFEGRTEGGEAEALLMHGYRGLKNAEQLPPDLAHLRKQALLRLVNYYDNRGDTAEAARWRSQEQ